MNGFIEIAENQNGFQELLKYHKENITPVRVTSTAESQKVHLAFSLCRKLDKGLLYISADSLSSSLESLDSFKYPED